MKFSIDRASLLRSLNHVQSAVERRNTIPILSNVLLRAAKGTLSLAATDMELEISESVAANVDAEGATTVPAHTFYEIVRKLPDDATIECALSSDGNRMTVKAGKSEFNLGCLPVSDFPEIGAGELDTTFALSPKDLQRLLDHTKFAMSTDDTRHYLNGIYVHAAKNGNVTVLRAAATDGHRLARFELAPLPSGAEQMPGIILPRKTVQELRKLLEEAADKIEISLSKNKIRFAFDHIVLASKLIDGTFPDYEKVIPQGNDKVVEINPANFSAAIDRVSTISDGKSRAVKITLNGKTMTVSANSPEAGSATEDVEVRSEASSIEVGFNGRYLMDVTTLINSDTCRLTMADASKPTIIQDPEDEAALYILMPLRV